LSSTERRRNEPRGFSSLMAKKPRESREHLANARDHWLNHVKPGIPSIPLGQPQIPPDIGRDSKSS